MRIGAVNPWLIPVLLLAVAILLLVALHGLVDGPGPAPTIEAPREEVIGAARAAPADPFRYGGRSVGDVLDSLEPAPGWQDRGWTVTPDPGGGYRAVRRFQKNGGPERVYAFTVSADLDRVWPANGRARALMHRGPRPER